MCSESQVFGLATSVETKDCQLVLASSSVVYMALVLSKQTGLSSHSTHNR